MRISVALLVAALGFTAAAGDGSRRIEYGDLPEALQRTFAAHDIPASAFAAYIARVQAESDRRVADGDRVVADGCGRLSDSGPALG